jgi:hypothetical protein
MSILLHTLDLALAEACRTVNTTCGDPVMSGLRFIQHVRELGGLPYNFTSKLSSGKNHALVFVCDGKEPLQANRPNISRNLHRDLIWGYVKDPRAVQRRRARARVQPCALHCTETLYLSCWDAVALVLESPPQSF